MDYLNYLLLILKLSLKVGIANGVRLKFVDRNFLLSNKVCM